jgi:hypothetical protein
MKTKKLTVFPDELLKVKEIGKRRRWKQITMARVGRSAKQKKILKMKDDPTMFMKTQGHVTQCYSQVCAFERVFETGSACFSLTVHPARGASLVRTLS